jgi:hypothetical protein
MYNKNKKIMNKEFIPYEQALELKELGFDEPCFGYYINGSKVLMVTSEKDINYLTGTSNKTFISAPLYQQAFRWFREKYNLDCFIDRGGAKGVYHAFVGGSEYGFLYGNNGNNLSEFTYEEAELECLIKLIEICKK